MPHKNVFLALGFEDDQATVEAWRSDLARIVRAHVTQSGKTRRAMARQLGIEPSALTPIINGDLGRISLERLVKLCVRLGTAGEARWSASAETAMVREVVGSASAQGRRKVARESARRRVALGGTEKKLGATRRRR